MWFTGLPSSGKTTTAAALRQRLYDEGVTVIHLDGDVVRKGLNSDLGLSEKDREENNRRIIHVSEIVVSGGVPVLSSFISPFKKTRDFAKEIIPNYIEVYVSTPVEVCMERDVKGLYAKAKKGEITGMTGLDAPYEVPESPEIVLETTEHSLKDNIDSIVRYLTENDYLEETDR
ncbi:MAG: putative adenylyl-sulfate kinase [candidate division WS6 bacterium OLB20]|uniref:Adenylyl-sulfate kinase n=1 Tax=candidate division WS6 bacterium OLB20 TaxID=1617426 RepID=A0A136LVZ1_9BACT|nr:MAG: putative adenylyl-sulfate kinase [candidate division WS6 bacterium OLB20]